jgi:putative tricarboxylic transport membrane protein
LEEYVSLTVKLTATLVAGVAAFAIAPQAGAWTPTKPIEFIATAGPGGGTDNFTRAVQAAIVKNKLVDQPIVVVNKPGGSGAEGFTYTKALTGDPYHLVFGTSNAWSQPLVSKVAFNYTDFTPVAAMVQDEFLLWVKQDAPYQNVQDYLAAMKAKGNTAKMAGAQSKDTDETLTRLIGKAAGIKFIYVPFKSGAEAAVQLAGGHVDSHVNNPSESVGQWKGGTQRPICVFNTKRLPDTGKVTATQGWQDIPTCQEQGLNIALFQQPRTIWLPLKVTPEQQAYYVDLMKKVQATPEWKDFIEKSVQTNTFLAGDDFTKYEAQDLAQWRKVATDEGWLVK